MQQLIRKDNCKILTEHLNNEYEEMETEVVILKSNRQKEYPKKYRRNAPLPIIGKVSNVLFGILDEETAEKYDSQINKLTLRINEHNNILSDQTTIIKKSITSISNTINKFEKKIQNLAIDVKKEITNYNKILNEVELREKLNFLTEIAILIIIEHKETQNSLNAIMKDTTAGDIPHLIPIHTLKNDLRLIKEQLYSNENLPINLDSDNIHNIFLFCKIKTGEKSDRVLIEISIPTVENKIFTVFEITPIPIKRENNIQMLKIKSHKMLVNFETSEIIEPGNQDCLGNDRTGRVCTSHSPILSSKSENCETSLLLSNQI